MLLVFCVSSVILRLFRYIAPFSNGMFAFPLLAIIFGIFHNLLATRIFRKRGGGMAKFFLLTTTMLIMGSFLVLIRLLGEG